ncbi:DNA-deoxyinosine glycosylase [Sulfurovum sp.]|jgi:hypoxanthine-DNA glycosylase|uniref:DNA-deoxyinosine glycosylase n=1 Tax=Sulfurovum sp. TaxID=1969726 RepID=UPI002A362759|nr:DNA-deoxyinosine glycosylase [Sulfurovum sp.]MDY0402032.1 DNA-deoxyinosine glycosylase [Sulfurovum sp.]
MSSENLEHPFDPIVFRDTEILVLGSFPSIQSFENNFYYGHPRNQFWKIMEAVTGYPINNRDQKIWLLKEAKVGLWDMVASCQRDNSSDSCLEEVKPNDIEALLEKFPKIKKVCFTGKKAETLFRKYFSHLSVETCYLPSPSPAYQAMDFEQKVLQYREKLGCEEGV